MGVFTHTQKPQLTRKRGQYQRCTWCRTWLSRNKGTDWRHPDGTQWLLCDVCNYAVYQGYTPDTLDFACCEAPQHDDQQRVVASWYDGETFHCTDCVRDQVENAYDCNTCMAWFGGHRFTYLPTGVSYPLRRLHHLRWDRVPPSTLHK